MITGKPATASAQPTDPLGPHAPHRPGLPQPTRHRARLTPRIPCHDPVKLHWGGRVWLISIRPGRARRANQLPPTRSQAIRRLPDEARGSGRSGHRWTRDGRTSTRAHADERALRTPYIYALTCISLTVGRPHIQPRDSCRRRACRFCAASLSVTWLDCLSLGSAMRVDDRFLCDGAYARCAGLTCTCVEPLAGPYTWRTSAGPAMLCCGWTRRRPAGHSQCSPS